MPDVFKNDVVETTAIPVATETEIIGDLFKLTKATAIPWRYNYLTKTVKECYKFVEGRHWDDADVALLGLDDVPALSIDRISRVKDTVNGIKENTANKKKIVKRESGDTRVAELLDLVYDYYDYQGGWQEARNDSFNAMLDVGMGIRKVGYDPYENGGEGTIYAETISVEDFGHSKCKSKTLKDISWAWHKQNMPWEDAMRIVPEKAAEIKGLKQTLVSEYESMKGGVSSTGITKDYGNGQTSQADEPYGYPDEVCIWEFWVKRRIPYKKIGSIGIGVAPSPMDGSPVPVPAPQVRREAFDYKPVDGEQEIATEILEVWHQFLVASGQGESSAILLRESQDDDHPFVAECAERKKSGDPVGLVEKVIPHQKRINIAWAQKTSWNNHAIKAPLIMEEGAVDYENGIRSSKIGTILEVKNGKKILNMNQVPNVNLQAIEEGNSARSDMDFIAAASEPVLRGEAETGASGIRLAQQQSAAVTPLNKWVKAEQDAEREFARKVLRLIVRYVQPQKMARIVGEQKMLELMTPKIDPVTRQVIEAPLMLPLQPDAGQYDVVIQDQALSDFNKQQTFNSVMALQGMSPMGMFTDDFIIKSAPIKNVDDALKSNQQHRNDVLIQMQQQMQMMAQQIGELEKQVPKTTNQTANAQRGRSEPQSGKKKMVGGQNG